MMKSWIRCELESDNSEHPIFLDLHLPLELPLAILHRSLSELPDGTRIKVLSGILQDTIWIKQQKHTSYLVGDYEEHYQSMMQSLIHPGDIFWDMGAHHGFYSIIAHQLGAKSIVAFEPRWENIEVICNIAALNQINNIVICHGCIGKDEGDVEFHQDKDDTMWNKTADIEPNPELRGREYSTITVPQHSIDAIIEEHKFEIPTIIKMDVEGSESYVLLGGERLLSSAHPTIFLGYHGAIQKELCYDLLQKYGYQIEEIVGDTFIAKGKI